MTALEVATGPLLPAVSPDRDASANRLLHLDPRRETLTDLGIDALASRLEPADLVVVNDAATLPASLRGTSSRGEVELRLCGVPPDGDGGRWQAVLFGAGSWRDRTEERPAPPRLGVGEAIEIARLGEADLTARVVSVSAVSPRLVELRFDLCGAPLWSALYRLGRPVQYAHTRAPLALWDVQTAYAGRPLAAEMPSAGRPLRLPLLRALRSRRIALATVTHAAGLSSTGDPALDAALPLPERSLLPASAVAAIECARRAGGRVLAVGTSVVRALEGAALDGPLRAGGSVRHERIGQGHQLRVVSGLLTGLHAPGESHFELLQAFAPRALLERALVHAGEAGYLGHEFGDSMLILPGG